LGEKRECRSVRVEIESWASWGRVLVVEVGIFMREGVVDVFDSVFCIRLVVVGFMEIYCADKNTFLTHQEGDERLLC
jgi:hypothetical protein